MEYNDYWDLFDAVCEIKKKETAPNIIGIITLDDEKNLMTAVCGLLKTMTPRKNTSIKLDSLRLRARGDESKFEHALMDFYFLDHNKYNIYDDYEFFRIRLLAYADNIPNEIINEYLAVAKIVFAGKPVEDAIKEVEKR